MNIQELRNQAKERKINITANGRYKTKEQLINELGNNVDVNKKVKQIIIPPSSKPTVININMTQNNNPSHQVITKPEATVHNVSIPVIPIERFQRQEIPRVGESEEDRIAREETAKSLAYARSKSSVSSGDLLSALMAKRRKAIAQEEKGEGFRRRFRGGFCH